MMMRSCEYPSPAPERPSVDWSSPSKNKSTDQDSDASSSVIGSGDDKPAERSWKCYRINSQTGHPCDFIFDSPKKLQLHQDGVHGISRPYNCQLCEGGRSFSTQSALVRHMRIVHPNVQQGRSQGNSQAIPPILPISSRHEHYSPAHSPSQVGSPMSFTETSTEVLEYNTEGRVTKRTYSRTSSRSPVSGDTFRHDWQKAPETASAPTYDQTQPRGRHRLPSISTFSRMPRTLQETNDSTIDVEVEADLDFLDHAIEAMRPEDSLACSARLRSIRMRVRTLTTDLREERQRHAELATFNPRNDRNYPHLSGFPTNLEIPPTPPNLQDRSSMQFGAYGESNV